MATTTQRTESGLQTKYFMLMPRAPSPGLAYADHLLAKDLMAWIAREAAVDTKVRQGTEVLDAR